MTRTRGRRARQRGFPIAAAAVVLGLSAGFAAWGVESAVVGSRTSARRDDVRAVLASARSLLARRQDAAAAESSRLAASSRVQVAFARRDAAALARVARSRPGVSFVLWNGRVVGSALGTGPRASVGVYGAEGLIGRVVVAAAPDTALLLRARESAREVHLASAAAGRVVAASPSASGEIAPLLRGTISDSLLLGPAPAARLYAWVSRPGVPGYAWWPPLFGLLVAVGSFLAFARAEARRQAEPPPSPVREAVALVGETLAATHNTKALLPVILRATVEATGATGGTISQAGKVVVSRGSTGDGGAETIDLPLQVDESTSVVLTLFAPPDGFHDDARDAAAWIGSQAVIALENARLHGFVQRQAVTDELTGLGNRRRFLAALDNEVARSRRSGLPLAVVLADLDDFKRVNDTWGHDVGDEALRSFASILRSTARDVDLPVRLGGEEFAVLLPGADLDGGAQFAERVRRTLERTVVKTAQAEFTLTASFGVSCYPVAAAAEEVLADADRRLYEAKRRGKNQVVSSVADGSSRAP